LPTVQNHSAALARLPQRFSTAKQQTKRVPHPRWDEPDTSGSDSIDFWYSALYHAHFSGERIGNGEFIQPDRFAPLTFSWHGGLGK